MHAWNRQWQSRALLALSHTTYVYLQAKKHHEERYKNTHSYGYPTLRELDKAREARAEDKQTNYWLIGTQ